MAENPIFSQGAASVTALAKETVFADNGIVSRTLLSTPSVRMTLFAFAEGQELTEHASTRHAVVQMLSGRCDFTVSGVVHALKAGDLLYMPPSTPHAVRATEPFSMLLTLARDEPAGSAATRS
ncbi:cupin domain-containing protein [Opitutaceae bacterium EW11]|nr:cupin domain-containing protein [Opitutaceae bacterium EW11]